MHGLGKKILEEAGEVWLAAEHEGDDALAGEISQLLYWTQVLMISRGCPSTTSTRNCERHAAGRGPEQGHAERACRRDPLGGRLPTSHRSEGPDGHRSDQQRRVLLSAPQGHRDLRGIGAAGFRYHRSGSDRRIRRTRSRTAGAGLRFVHVPIRRPRRSATGPSPIWRASESPPHFPTWSERIWRRGDRCHRHPSRRCRGDLRRARRGRRHRRRGRFRPHAGTARPGRLR